MSIQPQFVNSPGTIQGVNQRLADMHRRMASFEAARTVINTGSVPGDAIQPGSIVASHLAANSVTAGAIAAGTIQAGHITAGAIQAGHMSADSIDTLHLVAGSVTANEIAANSIQAGHIVAGTITATHLSAGSISTEKIQAGAVTAEKITTSSLSAISSNMGNINAGTITGATIQTAQSGARTKMDSTGLVGYGADGVTKIFEIFGGVATFSGIATLAPGSSVPSTVVTGQMTDAQIAAVASAKLTGQITSTQITDSAISTPKLAAGAVEAAKIAAGAITTEKMTAGTINADRLIGGSITATQIGASAITANAIQAGAIKTHILTVEFGGTNKLLNSQADRSDLAIAPWATISGSAAPSTDQAWEGTKSFKLLPSDNSIMYFYQNAGRVLPDKWYTFSAYCYRPSTSAGNPRLYINFYDAANNLLASAFTDGTTATNVWQRIIHSWLAPANSSYAIVYASVQYPGINQPVYYDALQFEPGEIASAFSRAPGEILPGEVGATQITPNSITSNEIMGRSILAADIVTGTLTGNEIQSRSIQGDRITTTTLSAITADMGEIQAGRITGGTIRTAPSGTRIELDINGFRQYLGSSSTPSIHFKTDGSDTNIFTGKIQARGVTFPGATSLGTSFSTADWQTDAGIQYAQITGAKDGSGIEFLRMEAGPGINGNGTKARLDLSTNNGGTALIFAEAYQGSSGIRDQLLSHTGSSAFLRGPAGYASRSRFQFGSTTFFAYAMGGQQSVTVNLGVSWAVTHQAFISSLAPEQTLEGFNATGGGVLSNNAGIAYYYNTSMGQNLILSFISIGY